MSVLACGSQPTENENSGAPSTPAVVLESNSAVQPSAEMPSASATVSDSATGPAPSVPAVTEQRPGVIVRESDTAPLTCVLLCTNVTESDGDDWAFEDGVSCVIPDTATGHNQKCTTGEALPEPESVPGVVVKNPDTSARECIALCTYATDPAADPEMDGWSWENNASCVIPETSTAANQKCSTLLAVPDPEPRPGIIVTDDADELTCAPLCTVSTTPTEEGADWAYEDNESCVLADSPTTTGRRSCTFTQFPPDYTPPALPGNTLADGFYVEGDRLKDAFGNDFVPRGVNNAHIWYDGHAEYKAWNALDNIATTGANSVRVVWETTGGSPLLLADILSRVVELHMIPILELHDTTGVRSAQVLLDAAAYYAQPDVLAVLQQFRQYLLINIGNEWSGTDIFIDTYMTAIATLRAAGIDHTLVIDASGFGQNAQSILDAAAPLTESDPLHNILYSIHMYDLFADPERVRSVLQDYVAAQIPIMVGEFGPELSGTAVAWEQIVSSCNELKLGYLAWSWTGNDVDTEQLDMAEDWEGPLTTWGEAIVNGPGGIHETSVPASIYTP